MSLKGVVAALGIFVIALAGCGGGGGGESEAAPTKAEFIKQADAVCADVNKQVEAGFKELGDSPSTAEVKKFVDEVSIPQIQHQIDEIGDMTPPAGDEDQIQAILDGWADANKASEDVNATTDPFADVDKLSTAYGFEECNHG